MHYFQKEESFKLSLHLKHSEFRCKCNYPDCTFTLVDFYILENYEVVRSLLNMKLRCTSGFRCQRHNSDVSGVDASFHKLGLALDLQPFDKESKKKFNHDLDKLENACRQQFSFVKRYETFVHCH